jgi:hypothetical protein
VAQQFTLRGVTFSLFGQSKDMRGRVKEMKKTSASLPELMQAASQVAFECSENEREAYRLTQKALIEFIRNLPENLEFPEFPEFDFLSDRYVH